MKMGKMTQEECEFAESCMSRSIGHCMTMGTASTMACMVESLGLPYGASAIPAADKKKTNGPIKRQKNSGNGKGKFNH